MLKLLYCALLAVMAACASPTPTPSPTATPAPTATPRPTATPIPTLQPTATVAPSGVITPLYADDPQAFLASLPADEQACLAENFDLTQVLPMGRLPTTEIATPQEAAAFAVGFINCLGDDTLMRIYVSGILAGNGPLSQASSDCVRAGFAGFDPRPALLAGANRETESELIVARAGSLASFFMVLSCLNEAEWPAAGPFLDLNLADRKSLQCMRETLGGPAELAAGLYRYHDESSPAFASAEARCGLNWTQ